jgi:hypothetical protein
MADKYLVLQLLEFYQKGITSTRNFWEARPEAEEIL